MAALDVTRRAPGPQAAGPVFYFDLASPEAYLAAERVLQAMPVATPWVPVLARLTAEVDRDDLAARAARAGLQPVRWPDPFPFDSTLAMQAATFARSAGRVVAFTLAAFRQAFAGGRALSGEDSVVIAGSACELHPRALLAGCATTSVRKALARETELAIARGLQSAPAIWVPGSGGSELFDGPDCVERAAAAAAEAPR